MRPPGTAYPEYSEWIIPSAARGIKGRAPRWMRTSLTGTQRVWQAGKPFLLPDGTRAADTAATEDVLALFGDSASITVEFRIGDKTVAEAKLKP